MQWYKSFTYSHTHVHAHKHKITYTKLPSGGGREFPSAFSSSISYSMFFIRSNTILPVGGCDTVIQDLKYSCAASSNNMYSCDPSNRSLKKEIEILAAKVVQYLHFYISLLS